MEDLKLESLWGYKLRELVEGIFSPQYMYNSLPFVVQKDEEHQIRWFYYDIESKNNKCYLNVKRIITLDGTGRCAITLNPLVKLEWDLKTVCAQSPEMDFYDAFLVEFKKGNYDAIQNMLQEFESEEASALYEQLSRKYL